MTNFNPKTKILIVYFFLIAFSLAVLWQVNQYNFIDFDDPVYITQNAQVLSGITWEGICWAFTTIYADFWHPLTWISLMIDSQIYGLNAGGYHLTNLILHILSTLLLFWLFNRMTGTIGRSAFVAALFALHPLHVESVAWIAKRKDVLSAFFWMLTLCFYVYYTERPTIKRYLPVLFSFLLALMSKPMVITLPIIMILFDFWPLERFKLQKKNWLVWQCREKIPLLILSFFFSVITLFVHGQPYPEHFPLDSRMANAFVSLVIYLEKTFWPHNLAVFYPYSLQLPTWQIIGAIVTLIIISIAAIMTLKQLPYFFVGWTWYLITILPVSGIIQVSPRSMSDNYTYLPLIGIFIVVAWIIPSLSTRKLFQRTILFPAAITLLICLSVLTWQQCGYWKNSVTLFGHALIATKNNYLAHNNFGHALFEDGNTLDALEHFQTAIKINPIYTGAYTNLGNAYAKLGQYTKAFENYNKAIKIQPDFAETYYNRGTTYGEIGQYKSAIEDLNKAISLKADYVDAYFNKGTIYAKLLQYQKAIEEFDKAIKLNPSYIMAYYSRGFAYLLQGDYDNGCLDAQKICGWGNCQLLDFAKSKGYCR